MYRGNFSIPSGVTFKFAVTPSIRSCHQQGVRDFIVNDSGLGEYFKYIEVSFFDGCYMNKKGFIITDDKLRAKQMQIKVFCPEPTIVIDKSEEEDFYKHIKEKFSNCIIDSIHSNAETKYDVKLDAFLLTKE